jgi:hypothetical protein
MNWKSWKGKDVDGHGTSGQETQRYLLPITNPLASQSK